MSARRRSAAAGFSLLELVVAITVLSLALAMLYQAASGATRNVRSDEKYAYGVEIARSLLADNSRIPMSGVQKSGATSGGFRWVVASEPVAAAAQGAMTKLHRIEIRVSWDDGLRRPEIKLDSIVEGFAL